MKNYFKPEFLLVLIGILILSSCEKENDILEDGFTEQNLNDVQTIEQLKLKQVNRDVLVDIEIIQLSREELTDLESELNKEARSLQTEFFTLLEETNDTATIRTGRNLLRTQRGLITITREFIRRARIVSDQGEISTRRRIIELQRDFLSEIRAEIDFLLNN